MPPKLMCPQPPVALSTTRMRARFPAFPHADPRFQAMLHDMADWWIERGRELEAPTQGELQSVALAHIVRGEKREALALLERALEIGGPRDARLRGLVAELRADLRAGRPAPPPTPAAAP